MASSGVIEGVWRLSAHDHDIALVKLQFYGAAHPFLSTVKEGVQSFPQRAIPLPVIDQLGIFQGHLLLEMHRITVEAEILELPMA